MSKELEGEKILLEVQNAIAKGTEILIIDGVNDPELFELIHSNIRIPILDSICIALKIAEIMHSLKLSHSKLSYPKPTLPAYHKKRIKKLTDALKKSMLLYT